MQISNLTIPQLTQLTQQEQTELILNVRARRRVLPEKKSRGVKSTKTRKISSSVLNTLTHEQLLQLAAVLNKE